MTVKELKEMLIGIPEEKVVVRFTFLGTILTEAEIIHDFTDVTYLDNENVIQQADVVII